MRNAERGASQIPLVICIVLLLVAGFFAYNQYSERADLEKSLNEIRAVAQRPGDPSPPRDDQIKNYITFAMGTGAKYSARLDELAPLTGGAEEEDLEMVISPKKLQGTITRVVDGLDKGLTVEFPLDRFTEDPSGGMKIQEAAGKIVINYGGTRDLKGNRPDMTNILEYLVLPAMHRMVHDIKRFRDSYVAALNAKETAEASYRKDLEGKDGEIRAKVEEFSAMENNKNQQITDLRRQLSDAEAAKAAAEEEKNRTVAAVTAERNAAQSELAKMSGNVQVLKARKREVETDTSPDGTVLSVGEKQDFVVVDLGKASNNLQAGTNFDVYAIGKGGQEIPKGAVKVVKVDGTSSNCRVLDVFDAFNPIAPGDRIRSLFYSPKETIHVALVGRFQKMGKSDAARRLQTLGVVVDDKVTINTTYLVVGAPEAEGQPIEETAEYKTAELYGIPRISERELGKFTMY